MKVLFTTIVFMFLLLFVGCSTEQAPTELTQNPTGHHDKDQPVDPGGGASVLHFEGTYAFYILDLDENLIALVGLDLEEWCNVGYNPDAVDFWEVTNPNDQILVNQLIHGNDMQCVVFPFVPGFGWCDYLTIDPLLTGFVDMNSTDNDLFAWVEANNGNQRVNSFKVAAHGALYDQDGVRVQANMLEKIVFSGWPDFEYSHAVTFINLAGF